MNSDLKLFATMVGFAFVAGACAFLTDFSRSMARDPEDKQ